jgi:hypothetical protein
MMYVANSDAVKSARGKLVAGKDVLREQLATMYQQHQALFSGRRTNFADTQARNARVKEAFATAIAKLEQP